MTIKNFIKKRSYLMWSVEDFDNVSEEAIVEAVLNYGDFDDVQEMIDILKIRNVAKIFEKQIKRKRNNYSPKIKNYFKLYFKKYA